MWAAPEVFSSARRKWSRAVLVPTWETAVDPCLTMRRVWREVCCGDHAGGAVTGGAEHPTPEGIHVLDIASPSA
jgi:hypothetical protein